VDTDPDVTRPSDDTRRGGSRELSAAACTFSTKTPCGSLGTAMQRQPIRPLAT
jgi:hypothetical protein